MNRLILVMAAAVALLIPSARAASSADALIEKLVAKGILTAEEAKSLKAESEKEDKAVLQSRTGMPSWVTGYRISGDFRGRLDTTMVDNPDYVDRIRGRYRLRVGFAATLLDNLETGFRLASGDAGGTSTSTTTTIENNGSKKPLWLDTAYGKWTALNSDAGSLSATIGKMDNPFQFTPMVFDADYTPEGAALQGKFSPNKDHSIGFNAGLFALDEVDKSSHDPLMYGGQVLWNARWNRQLSSTLGLAALHIVNEELLVTTNVPNNNQGNSRTSGGALLHDFNPVIGDASVTWTLDRFPLYTGQFPIKFASEFIHNPAAPANNDGWWVGVTLGKSGRKNTWDLTYRYEHLEADAWYDQVCDDDFGAFYLNAPAGGKAGYVTGTNVRGHLVRLNYSLTDSFSLGLTCFITDLIEPDHASAAGEPENGATRVQVDANWRF